MRLVHTGDPASIALLVESLRNDGLEVEYEEAHEPPEPQPDAALTAVVHLADHAAGTVIGLAVRSAIAKVSSRFPSSETVIADEHDHEEASEPPRGV